MIYFTGKLIRRCPEVITPGWIRTRSSNFTRTFERILKITRAGSAQTVSEPPESQTTAKNFIAGNL